MAGNRAAQRGLMLVALAWVMLVTAAQAAPIVIPDPGTRVVDTAHLLDAGTTSELDNLLARLEATTGAQVKVLTVPTTGDEDIFTFAQRQYQLWKLGSKDKKDGALIVLAPKDRKVRIHTGYGLEGSLPDSWIGSLSREVAAQYFKPGDYPGGLRAMTIAVVNKVADDAGKPLAGAPNIRHVAQPEQSTAGMILGILVLMLIIYLMYRASQNQRLGGRRAGPGWFGGFGGFGGGYSGGSFGGGSFGGGSFGGSFGGGGSSGGGGGGASW